MSELKVSDIAAGGLMLGLIANPVRCYRDAKGDPVGETAESDASGMKMW